MFFPERNKPLRQTRLMTHAINTDDHEPLRSEYMTWYAPADGSGRTPRFTDKRKEKKNAMKTNQIGIIEERSLEKNRWRSGRLYGCALAPNSVYGSRHVVFSDQQVDLSAFAMSTPGPRRGVSGKEVPLLLREPSLEILVTSLLGRKC